MKAVPLTDPVLKATVPTSFARGSSVYVVALGGSAAQAVPCFADAAGTEPLAQPLVADDGGVPRDKDGRIAYFWPGVYDRLIDGARIPWTAGAGDGLEVFDPAGKATARPVRNGQILWRFKEAPEHLAEGDLWLDTSSEVE